MPANLKRASRLALEKVANQDAPKLLSSRVEMVVCGGDDGVLVKGR